MVLYLVSNNCVLNNLIYKNNEALDEKREKRPLSIEGEEEAKRLCNLIENEINVIYTSSYASAIATSKFIANKFELSINIENKLNDRKIGLLKDKTLRFFKETQEHDFEYKLRSDEVEESIDIEELLANCDICTDREVEVPKVVG